MTKVSVFTTYPSLDASRRLRIDPVIRELIDRGCEVEVHCLITNWMFRHKNSGPGYRLAVGFVLFCHLLFRIYLIMGVSSDSTVLIHREAFPFFTPLAERVLKARARRIVLDVDDAIYVQPTHEGDWRKRWRDSERFVDVLALADLVTAGSPHMAEFAQHAGAGSVTLALTCPPIALQPARIERSTTPRILWTGGQSTLGSLAAVLGDVCDALAQTDGAKLVVLGGQNVTTLTQSPFVVVRTWSPSVELEELSRCWFGIMPIPDLPWERGKSGYKAILYLSAGLPALVSPVGFNVWLAKQVHSVRLVADGEWFKEVLDQIHRGPSGQMVQADLSWLSRNVDAHANAQRIADLLLHL